MMQTSNERPEQSNNGDLKTPVELRQQSNDGRKNTQKLELLEMPRDEQSYEVPALGGQIAKNSEKFIKQPAGFQKLQGSSSRLTILSQSEASMFAGFISQSISKLLRNTKTARSVTNLPLSKPNSLRRSRALKRGGSELLPISEGHFKYAWAAYKRGVFSDAFPEGLDAADFTAHLADTVLTVERMGGEVITAIADTPKGHIPVGITTIEYQGEKAFPHVVWFPEASHRNKLELGLTLFIALKDKHLVLVTAKTPRNEKSADVKYFEHLGKYGVLRRAGTIWGYFGEDSAVIFHSVNLDGQKRPEDIGSS